MKFVVFVPLFVLLCAQLWACSAADDYSLTSSYSLLPSPAKSKYETIVTITAGLQAAFGKPLGFVLALPLAIIYATVVGIKKVVSLPIIRIFFIPLRIVLFFIKLAFDSFARLIKLAEKFRTDLA